MEYKNPAVTADIIIERAEGQIALIRRLNEPFKGQWALPGGFLDYSKENGKEAAIREALEETNMAITYPRLVGEYSDPDRDPRGHTVTLVYYARVDKWEASKAKAKDDALELKWFTIEELVTMINEGKHGGLAFDHRFIIGNWLTDVDR